MWQWYTLEDIVLPSSPAAFSYLPNWGLSQGLSGKESTCQCRRCRRCRFHSWVGKIPRKNKWQSTPVFLPGKPHGHKSLMGYRLWGHKELDRTKQLSTHTHTHTHICPIDLNADIHTYTQVCTEPFIPALLTTATKLGTASFCLAHFYLTMSIWKHQVWIGLLPFLSLKFSHAFCLYAYLRCWKSRDRI